MSWSWFLFVSTLLLGSRSSSFLRCHSRPSNLCGHINATAFFFRQNKTWINATVNILSALAVCDYACRWLFFNASLELSVKSAWFPGEDACWHRNVLSFLWSSVRRVFLSSGSTFLGLRFSLLQSERLGDVRCRGIAPASLAERPRLDAPFLCQANSEESVRQGVTEPLQKRDSRFSPLHPSHWERCWDPCLS